MSRSRLSAVPAELLARNYEQSTMTNHTPIKCPNCHQSVTCRCKLITIDRTQYCEQCRPVRRQKYQTPAPVPAQGAS